MSLRNLSAPSLLRKKTGYLRLSGFYRLFLGKREKQNVWIVDGEKVCLELFPDFIMGGNDQRYRFNPYGDVWIDNRLGIEELEYTIAHELIERRFMKERGWTYERAHNEGGLWVESVLRKRDAKFVAKHGAPYRSFAGRRKGNAVWIVDGPYVRANLNPDFCFGTHDLKSQFVPGNQIWLDSAMSVEEAYYALRHQIIEREHLASGVTFDDAYEAAQNAVQGQRAQRIVNALRHEAKLPLVEYGVRSRGVKSR